MRIRTLLVAVGGLAACSSPQPAPPAAARDLQLGTSPVRDTAVVSALESGRPLPKPRTVPPAGHAAPANVAVLVADRAPAPKLALASTTTALAEPTHDFKDAPEPIEVLVATGPGPETAPGLGISSGYLRGGSGQGGWAPAGRRGGVIIRGGVGGVDDDCDIRHPRSSPIAIHSVAPNFRGGIH